MDVAAIRGLLHQIMHHHGVSPPPDGALTAVVETVLGASDHTFLVAERDGEVIAMCALIFSLSTWSAGLVCELQDLIVSREFRGQGVGRGLVRAAAEHAHTQGCLRLFLSAESFNLPAHAFYRVLGFAEKAVLYFETPVPNPSAD